MSYFREHAPVISKAALASNTGFIRASLLVSLSIRQPFHKVPGQVRDTMETGLDSPWLFGFKRETLAYVMRYPGKLRRYSLDYMSGKETLESLILRFLEIPGLGIVKASFLAQCVVNNGACLDTHNLERFGINPESFKIRPEMSRETKLARIRHYNETWKLIGDSGFFWDSWCDYLVNTGHNRKRFANGYQVSLAHVEAMGI